MENNLTAEQIGDLENRAHFIRDAAGPEQSVGVSQEELLKLCEMARGSVKRVSQLYDNVCFITVQNEKLRQERDAAVARDEAARSALIGMCHQYLPVSDGKMQHDFMSAGEEAFEVLDWPDTGQPVDKSCLCEVDGCGNTWTSRSQDGDKYHRFCWHHQQEHDRAKALPAGPGVGG